MSSFVTKPLKIGASDLRRGVGYSYCEALHMKVNTFLGRKWKQRYAIISKGCLYIYIDMYSKKPERAYTLSTCKSARAYKKDDDDEVGFSFRLLEIDKKPLLFSCDTAERRETWLEKINTEISEIHIYTDSGFSESASSDPWTYSGTDSLQVHPYSYVDDIDRKKKLKESIPDQACHSTDSLQVHPYSYVDDIDRKKKLKESIPDQACHSNDTLQRHTYTNVDAIDRKKKLQESIPDHGGHRNDSTQRHTFTYVTAIDRKKKLQESISDQGGYTSTESIPHADETLYFISVRGGQETESVRRGFKSLSFNDTASALYVRAGQDKDSDNIIERGNSPAKILYENSVEPVRKFVREGYNRKTQKDVKKVMEGKPEGTFIVYPGEETKQILCVMTLKGLKHFRIYEQDEWVSLFKDFSGAPKVFRTLDHLLFHYYYHDLPGYGYSVKLKTKCAWLQKTAVISESHPNLSADSRYDGNASSIQGTSPGDKDVQSDIYMYIGDDSERTTKQPFSVQTSYGIGQWNKCFQMPDERNRLNEANKLLSMTMLPDNSQLERACIVFGRWSDTFFAICKAVSEFIRTVSTEIIDVWAAYRCSEIQQCSNIEVVFVTITKTGKTDIKVDDYEIYERGQSDFSKESEEVMICVEKAQKRGYIFDESDLVALENCVSENTEIIMNSHEKVCVMSPSVKKSTYFGKENASICDELCISLYVHIKGLIPIKERPFPTKIGNFRTDVLEDRFIPFHGGPLHYHEHLKMGLAIHAKATDIRGDLLVGTLGGFLDHPSSGLCGLTSAHVVLSGTEMDELKTEGCLDFSKYKKEVFQPIDSSSTAFGQVISARFCEGGNGSAGMEAALFQICKRRPMCGIFPAADNYNDVGFDDKNPMVYNTGKVCEVSQIRRRADAYKYGVTTGATRGSIGLCGSVIRTMEMSGKCQTLTYRLCNQIQIIRIGEQDFALPGDSGALVFFDDASNDSVAIGIVEGGLNNRTVFVTPICDILKKFDCPLNMKTFKQDDETNYSRISKPGEEYMECE